MHERSEQGDMGKSVNSTGRGVEEEPDDPLRLTAQTRGDSHERAHVDLDQDEYTAEEAARLLGTSLEVIMHAVREGELNAEKAGSKVTCIKRADLTEWMNRQEPGV